MEYRYGVSLGHKKMSSMTFPFLFIDEGHVLYDKQEILLETAFLVLFVVLDPERGLGGCRHLGMA